METRLFPWEDDGRESSSSLSRIRLRSIRQSLAHIVRYPIVTVFVWLLMGIALSLPAGFWMVQHSIHSLTQELDSDTGFAVYFIRGAEEEAIEASAQTVRNHSAVDHVQVITAEQALEEFRSEVGFESELDELESNPLPASLSVRVALGTTRDEVVELAQQLEQDPAVDGVVVDTEWMTQLRRIKQVAVRLTWIIGALFGIGIVLVSIAAVRYAIDVRLAELKVIELFGASKRFMRRPFLYCGVLYGVGGGIVATLIIAMAMQAIRKPLIELASSYGGDVGQLEINYWMAAVLVMAGGVLGLSGALQATLAQTRRNQIVDQG